MFTNFHQLKKMQNAKEKVGEQQQQKYPWESPEVDLRATRALIEKHGYWRRKEELEDAEAALPGGDS